MKGRKIHALVDTQGLPLRIVIHSAGVQDRDGAAFVLDKIRNSFPWLELLWADSGYNAHQVNAAVAKVPSLRIEIVKRSDDMKGFILLPRRWVVERTFSWFGRNRRLAKIGKISPPRFKPSSLSPRSRSQSDDSRVSCLLSQALRRRNATPEPLSPHMGQCFWQLNSI